MDWQNSDVLSTKIKSKPINLSWQQNSLVERMSRKEGFPKDQGYHGKLSQPATHWISLINKWSHIILWQPHLSGIWWLIRSLDQSGFHISTIMPTNYLANKNYQSLLMQNRKDLSKRCNLPLQKMMRKSAHCLHFAIGFSDKRLSMHSTSFGKAGLKRNLNLGVIAASQQKPKQLQLFIPNLDRY